MQLSGTATLLLSAVLLQAAAGCASSAAGRWTRADYDLGAGRDATPAGAEPLTSRIFLIADNQRHELLGERVRLYRMAVSDELTLVAIRPPQLDLFGQELLREALEMADGFVLHLGDACDISNTGEFGRFAWDMRRAAAGWAMAPGNHDGYFFGNSSRLLGDLVREWDATGETYDHDGTRIDSRAMQKDRFVSHYLAAQILQDAAWSGPLARSIGPGAERALARWRERQRERERDGASFADYWRALSELQETIHALDREAGDRPYGLFELPDRAGADGEPRLRRVAWHIDRKLVWRSFVVQEVDIGPGVSILVLDSAQYGAQPSLEAAAVSGLASKVTRGYFDEQTAGEHGNVLESQRRAATRIADAMRDERRRWLVATHHPYRDLGRRTRPRFDDLRDAGGIPVTLSAHSHVGEVLWNRDDEREGSWLEISVGSVLDAPAEFRDFQLHRVGDRLAVRSERHGMEERLRDRGLLLAEEAGHRPYPGDPDYFMDYETRGFPGTSAEDWSARQAEFRVKRLLLAAYRRLFERFEADALDQTGTYRPIGPDGTRLETHAAVLEALAASLAEPEVENVATMTRFLYELREFDRTRAFSPERARELRAYRLSQALWAGQAERRTWETEPRGIVPDPAYLVLPASATEPR